MSLPQILGALLAMLVPEDRLSAVTVARPYSSKRGIEMDQKIASVEEKGAEIEFKGDDPLSPESPATVMMKKRQAAIGVIEK